MLHLEAFDVKDGIIQNPGKFESEPIWVPYYWDLMMEGEGEDVYPEASFGDDWTEAEVEYTSFVVDSEESERFGLPCGAKVCIRTDSQGFVTGWVEE